MSTPSGKSIKGARVAGIDPLAALLAQVLRHGDEWIVEIPVRVVGREQDAVEADRLHNLDEMGRIVRPLHRLGRHPEMLAQILRRWPFDLRQARTHALPIAIEAMTEGGNPAKAA